MGYKSEVAYKSVGWKSRNEAIKHIDKLIKQYDYSDIDYIIKNIKVEETGKGIEIKYYEECIKWYESYKEIEFAEEVFYKVPDHVAYCFTRLGEEDTDIEQKYSNNNNINIPWIYITKKIDMEEF